MEKLIKIQAKLKAPKDKFNSFGNYSYRSAEGILDALKPLLEEEGLLLTVSDELVMLGERFYVKATAQITDGSTFSMVTAYAREELTKKGMDGAQVTGAASSYARKYALSGLFLIDDGQDPDSQNKHGKEQSEKPQGKPNSPPQQQKPAENGEVSKQREEIRTLILEMANGDIEHAKAILKQITSFTGKDGKEVPGKVSVDLLTDKQVPYALKDVKRAYEAEKGGGQ